MAMHNNEQIQSSNCSENYNPTQLEQELEAITLEYRTFRRKLSALRIEVGQISRILKLFPSDMDKERLLDLDQKRALLEEMERKCLEYVETIKNYRERLKLLDFSFDVDNLGDLDFDQLVELYKTIVKKRDRLYRSRARRGGLDQERDNELKLLRSNAIRIKTEIRKRKPVKSSRNQNKKYEKVNNSTRKSRIERLEADILEIERRIEENVDQDEERLKIILDRKKDELIRLLS